MDLQLKNKIAFVTGSSKGIGRAIAEVLLKEGCNVILNGRNESVLKKTALELGIPKNYYIGDVTNLKICQQLSKRISNEFGKLDILVCNVGSGRTRKIDTETDNELTEMFTKNFLSATNIIKSFQQNLSKSQGSIICISSIAGIENTGAPIAYSIAKSALNMYVRSTAKHLAKKKIRINAIAPGNIIFKNSVWDKKLKENRTKVQEMINQNVALKRFGKPDEIGDLVAFLSSVRASFITGSIIVIDGGQIH